MITLCVRCRARTSRSARAWPSGPISRPGSGPVTTMAGFTGAFCRPLDFCSSICSYRSPGDSPPMLLTSLALSPYCLAGRCGLASTNARLRTDVQSRFRLSISAACADVFSATAARMSAFNAFLIDLVTLVEVDGAPGVAFEAGVEEA